MADGGGAQKYVLDLAAHFNGAIAAGTESTQLFTEAEKRGIKTFPLSHLKRNPNPIHDMLAIWQIKKIIQSYNPDIVHLNSSKAGFLGSLAAGLVKKVKVVFTAHGFFYFKDSAWYIKFSYSLLEKIASKFRNAIITVSEQDRQQGIKHHLLPPNKIITVYNGIPKVPFMGRDEARKNLNLSNNKLILGNIAQLYYRKGIDVLIKAAAILPTGIKEKIQIVIIGEGPEHVELQKQILQYNLGSVFILAGYHKDAVKLLKAFDLFISGSRREGFSYVLLEVLQAGLASIITNVGGNSEAMGNAGIIIPPENPELLTAAICEIINSPEKQKELSERALARSKEFTLEKMLSQTQEVYNSVISGN